jgi:hypothetical protein
MIAPEKKPCLRHELKYEIDQLEYQILQKKLCALLKPDPHMIFNGHCHYNVRSLYFDDLYGTALNDKEAGVYRRKKYRIRIYNNSDEFIKFERKTKIGAYMLKESARITRYEADRLIAKDFSFLVNTENHLLRDFFLETRCNLMRPVVIVEYEREAYIHPIGTVRVTFDTQLRTSFGYKEFFDQRFTGIPALEQQSIILEVKYNEVLPNYIRGLFPNTIKPQLAIGKFVICRNQQLCQTGLQ